MSTSADFIAESPRVQAEMDRLRALHATLHKALQVAAMEARPETDFAARESVVRGWLRQASVEIHQAKLAGPSAAPA